MTKKICIITGGNSGIGKAAAIQISQAGYRIIIACRDQQRGEQALKEIRQESESDYVDLMIVDMSLFSSIKKFAEDYLSSYQQLDVLIHNAAAFDVSKKEPIYSQTLERRRITMVKSTASTVDEYLQELPTERREVISTVRETILENLPEGYEETMNWGMISYEIPLERYPETYNGQPLGYAALAAQKHHYSLYLTGVYQDEEQEAQLKEGFEKAGKRLDMGKSCVRFRKLEDVPLDVIGQIIAGKSPEQLISSYETSRKK